MFGHAVIFTSRIYVSFTMESILAAAFGRAVDMQRGEADEVTEAAREVFDSGKGKLFMMIIMLSSKPYAPSSSYYCIIVYSGKS